MMRPKTSFIAAVFLLFALPVGAEVAELTRLKGFDNQVREGQQFDKARLSGEKAFYEEEEQWGEARRKAALEFKSSKKSTKSTDDGPEADIDAEVKKAYLKEQEKNRKVYSKQKETFDRAQHPELVTEIHELALDQERPRYDYKKRATFGAPSKLKSSASASAGSSPSRGTTPNFPSSFEDFPTGGTNPGGFVPAPDVPTDFGDIPPPPPPPMSFPDEGFGGGTDFGNDYIPPPPPPFEGETNF